MDNNRQNSSQSLRDFRTRIGHYNTLTEALAAAMLKGNLVWRIYDDTREPYDLIEISDFAKKYDQEHPITGTQFYWVSREGAIGLSMGLEYRVNWLFIPMEPGLELDDRVAKMGERMVLEDNVQEALGQQPEQQQPARPQQQRPAQQPAQQRPEQQQPQQRPAQQPEQQRPVKKQRPAQQQQPQQPQQRPVKKQQPQQQPTQQQPQQRPVKKQQPQQRPAQQQPQQQPVQQQPQQQPAQQQPQQRPVKKQPVQQRPVLQPIPPQQPARQQPMPQQPARRNMRKPAPEPAAENEGKSKLAMALGGIVALLLIVGLGFVAYDRFAGTPATPAQQDGATTTQTATPANEPAAPATGNANESLDAKALTAAAVNDLKSASTAGQGVDKLNKAIAQGGKESAEALYTLAQLYGRVYKDKGVLANVESLLPKDSKKAHELNEKAVALDATYYPSLYELGCDYMAGDARGAVDRDIDKAKQYFTQGVQYARQADDTGFTERFEIRLSSLE